MPLHLIPMGLVEREYWRILDNIGKFNRLLSNTPILFSKEVSFICVPNKVYQNGYTKKVFRTVPPQKLFYRQECRFPTYQYYNRLAICCVVV